MKVKKSDTVLCLIGPRKDELGGSAYYQSRNELGSNVPVIDYQYEHGMIYGVVECIDHEILHSCHDISDGGLITCVSEMVMGGRGDGKIGATVLLNDDLRADTLLFSESSGFVFEIDRKKFSEVEKVFRKFNVDVFEIGETLPESNLIVNVCDKELINIALSELSEAWMNGFREALE